MKKEINELEVRNIITIEDKQILREALDGINGWNFNPIVVVTNGIEDYYFICKVKTVIKNLEMKLAKVCIKIQEGKNPRLLGIEGIS
ncbi:hypothetical protein [Clostridium saccharobutylicum]|uniref:Uncharacterized protein n=1 Tax=Clostridium saccharobutylicum TaxID=169679 RepID=A0A1S8N210_CLOSA|nr:hypothetical protein [Clostridium saccharobutylicum]OOM10430.1 hypothetical protein CLOSAC_30510 [Clostridium saccharobutylicum]